MTISRRGSRNCGKEKAGREGPFRNGVQKGEKACFSGRKKRTVPDEGGGKKGSFLAPFVKGRKGGVDQLDFGKRHSAFG